MSVPRVISHIQSVTVRKRTEIPEKPPNTVFKVELDLSALNQGKDFQPLMHEHIGLMPAFVASDVRRCLSIDISTGKPAYRADKRNLMVPFEDPIVLYSILVAEDGKTRVVIIGTTARTYYLIGKERTGYFFIIAESSVDTKEAVINLYDNNLNKGPDVFNRTQDVTPGFFSALFKSVFDELLVYQFTVKTSGGTPVSARLYIDPNDSTRNMISVCGWVQDLELDVYPGTQIQRGYFSRPKVRTEETLP